MDTLREVYTTLDQWALGLSRLTYALLIGVVTALASLAVQLLLLNPDPVFAVTLGTTMTVLYYLGDPNSTAETAE